MRINPFDQKSGRIDAAVPALPELYAKPYDKNTVDPYTKVRIILMNGTEFEANWFSHQLHRHTVDNNLRRELALMRRVEQLQQKHLASLKPIDETLLETTIGYEQVAVDLTAALAAREPDKYVKQAFDFALLEDFDHLYRYADLLEMEHGISAERLVGGYTEIMPGRPTIAEHRHPFDDVRRSIDSKTAHPLTKLGVGIITAAEQQTMNYYMNVGSFYTSDLGRKLYAEIAMIEEQHVSHYGSLMDAKATWLENLLMHEYTECYLYCSCYHDETDEYVKSIWEQHYMQETAHLHKAAELLGKYEGKDWSQVIPGGDFPELLRLHSNKEYVRNVLKTVKLASNREDYTDISKLPDNHDFFTYQDKLIGGSVQNVASHTVIDEYIGDNGKDYRFEEARHPMPELADRRKDNTQIARTR
ncbi:MAG: hypothetical protein LBS99_00410 [Clostridiales bacterium]|jgi:hypothetical protein|nr:hypothetical protein [Clostridiales bacterium]